MEKDKNGFEIEELVRSLCDKQTIDALAILKSINKTKFENVTKSIVSFFDKYKTRIDFEVYLEIVKGIDKEMSISFQRRNDNFGLDEIEDL